MGDYFDQYEKEFTKKHGIVKERLNQISNLSGEKRKAAVQETQRLFDEVNHTFVKLEEESTRGAKAVVRKNQAKIKGLQTELSRTQQSLDHLLLTEGTQPRDQYGFNNKGGDDDNRRRLLMNNDILDDSTNRINSSHRMATDIENTGAATLSKMEGQKEQLLRARNNLQTIDDNMTRSRRILSGMARRVVTNNVILVLIIVVMMAIIGIIVYLKWIRHLVS
eukprot:TRINITY_DN1472_c0_g1_i1.p1 TRINITY_DN1472_c0_g1~~TRINITY_DN1472_c0_g1_i1.p1  ORF type:complete len:221 (-),score=55.57 TRINITY_DN1472_c0_g1_i1:52-714(-)